MASGSISVKMATLTLLQVAHHRNAHLLVTTLNAVNQGC